MRALALAAMLFLAGCTCYDTRSNLSYDPASVPWGVFDLYTPTCLGAKEPYPVIFYVHGGAWQMGDKSEGQQFADEFCPSGYAVVSINYPLSIATPPTGVWPAQINACEKALRWVRANAQTFHLDPDHIASMGVSAGGHLATMLGLRDDPQGPAGRVRFVVDLDGEQDMKLGDACMSDYTSIMTKVLGHGPPFTDAELTDISTVQRARPDVGVFICHGTKDPNVYFVNATELNAALLAAHADVEMRTVNDTCHGNCWKDPAVLPHLHSWLDARLKH